MSCALTVPRVARSVRHVLRVRDLGGVRAGAQRHPAGAGLVLPHAAAERRDLAHRGHAVGAARRGAVPAAHAGHGRAARRAHARLAAPRARRVPGLRGHAGLDRAVPGAHAHHPALQARLVTFLRCKVLNRDRQLYIYSSIRCSSFSFT